VIRRLGLGVDDASLSAPRLRRKIHIYSPCVLAVHDMGTYISFHVYPFYLLVVKMKA
jgi:hypothetical protein